MPWPFTPKPPNTPPGKPTPVPSSPPKKTIPPPPKKPR